MALWELEEFQGPQLLGYIRNVPVDEAYIASRWLPNRTIDDLAFEYIKGAYKKVVMAHVMAYDSEAPLHGKQAGGERVQGELPPIKRKARFSEKEIIRFLKPRANSADKQRAIDSVYDSIDELLAAVQARVEWLRVKALSEDTVEYDEAGITFEFDFGLDPKLQINLATGKDGNGDNVPGLTGVPWSTAATSNPLNDLVAIRNRYASRNPGKRLSEIVLPEEWIGYLQLNEAMRELIRGASAPTSILTPGEINALFSTYNLPTLTPYDVTVSKEEADGTIVDERVLDRKKGFGHGPQQVGETLWGPTAESLALVGTPLAGQAPGIYAKTYNTDEPPAEWTKVSAIAFPSLPNAHELVQVQFEA